MRRIADLELAKTAERVRERGIVGLEVGTTLMDRIVGEGYNEAMGARELRRAVTRLVDDALSDAVLHGRVGAAPCGELCAAMRRALPGIDAVAQRALPTRPPHHTPPPPACLPPLRAAAPWRHRLPGLRRRGAHAGDEPRRGQQHRQRPDRLLQPGVGGLRARRRPRRRRRLAATAWQRCGVTLRLPPTRPPPNLVRCDVIDDTHKQHRTQLNHC